MCLAFRPFIPFAIFLLLLNFPAGANANPEARKCRQKWIADAQSFVCVCSAEFCDEPEPTGKLGQGQIAIFSSDPRRERLERKLAEFRKREEEDEEAESRETVLLVDPSTHFQTIHGFGGAFSDAAGLNLNALSWTARENLLRTYFHPERGIGYSLGRVPIASTDFSTREYSYVEEDRDFQMDSFQLAREDLEAKIPHIQSAQKMSAGRLRLFAVPWASPAWMKSNGRMSGEGQLKGDLEGPFYSAYARYLKRFFDEYSARGIHFWGLTMQNQPESGLEKDFPFQAMFMDNHTQREFAARLLLPLLSQSPHTADLRLMVFDDVREHLISSALEIFSSQRPSSLTSLLCSLLHQLPPFLPEFAWKSAEKLFGCHSEENGPEGVDGLISGIGVHWYTLDGHERQSAFHEMFPDKFILATEACAGFLPDDPGPRLGNWTRGWMYGHDIVQNMRNWAVGWVDWNLCLDTRGGPNWVGNFVDAPILVDGARDEFYKQPMFYFLAHFSRFVPPGSVRIHSSPLEPVDSSIRQVDNVAFLTPSGQKVLVLISPLGEERTLQLAIRDGGSEAKVTLEPGSILTAVWD